MVPNPETVRELLLRLMVNVPSQQRTFLHVVVKLAAEEGEGGGGRGRGFKEWNKTLNM
jgi:hypothetical protein